MIKKEILKDIKDYIINNGGVSLDINTMKNTTIKSGYIVSLENYENKTKNINEVMQLITKYIDIINTLNSKEKIKKMYFVGVWYNDIDNYYYIDISKHFEKLRDAKTFGEKNKQLAIYNIKDNKSIYLNYNIVSYSIYKKVYDINNNIIDEKIEVIKDNIKEVSEYLKISIKEVYNILNNKSTNPYYNIYKDILNINEYVEGL